jgi:hypothetical protein
MPQFAIINTLLHNSKIPQRKSPSVKNVSTAKSKRMPVERITSRAASTRAATESNEGERLNAIEARLAALETQQISIDNVTNTLGSAAKLTMTDDRYWALNELNRQSVVKPADRGAVLYAGTVSLPSGAQYVWQRQDSTRELLERDWRDLSETISALAHPMRLEILKSALGQDRSTQDFMALPDMGTTGQLFHHIKALQDAGWLRSLQRGLYGVPGERVVPLLAILAAARG